MSKSKAVQPITTTAEVDSNNSASSSPIIERTAPAPAAGNVLSPTSQSFFEAISSKFRSRSRSPATKHLSSGSSSFGARSPNPRKSRSRSPNTAATGASAQNQPLPTAMPTQASSSPRAVPDRTYSSTSTYTSTSMKRQSSSGSERSEWEKMTYGRHSSDWLLGGWSFTGSVKKAWSKGDSTSS